MLEKLKAWLSDDSLFFSVLIVLVGGVAFMLGRASIEPNSTSTQIIAPVQLLEQIALPVAGQGTAVSAASAAETATSTESIPTTVGITTVIASKNGTKYHLPTCPGASQIKEANRLEFASIEQARAAGYEPAKNCPGLQ